VFDFVYTEVLSAGICPLRLAERFLRELKLFWMLPPSLGLLGKIVFVGRRSVLAPILSVRVALLFHSKEMSRSWLHKAGTALADFTVFRRGRIVHAGIGI
jgi:hypothetical protein